MPGNNRLIFLFGLFFYFGMPGSAEYNHVFEHLSTDDGLSHGSISAMMKDRHGFMWFATWDGLNRYDGYEFVTYKPGNPANSASNRIESMVEDVHGNIWVGTYDAKLFRFNRWQETFEQYPLAPDKTVQSFYISPKGDVWLSTASGFFQVVTDSITNGTSQNSYDLEGAISVPGNPVRFLAEDGAGNIWVNTKKGTVCLFEQTNGDYSPKDLPSSVRSLLNRDELTAWARMNDGTMVFGTSRGDLLMYDSWSGNMDEWSPGPSTAITHMGQDSLGRLILSTRGDGVWVVHGRDKKVLKHFYEPRLDRVLKTFADSRGRLWVETTQAGVVKIDLESGAVNYFRQTLNVPEDLRANAQIGIMEDADQTVWLTLKGGGFGYYDEATDEVAYFYNNPEDPDSELSNFVNCFYKDPSGVLWMGTYFKGLEKITFIERKFTHYRPAAATAFSIANEVRALLYDSHGFLWVATKNQEVFILNDRHELVHQISTLAGKGIGRVYAMMEDSGGRIYLGTRGNGLFELTRKEGFNYDVVHYKSKVNDANSLSDNNIYSLLEDRKGRIWVATYGGGINLKAGRQFLHGGNGLDNYPKNKGQKVRHLAEDAQGRLWAGTTDGLVVGEGEQPKEMTFQLINNENGRASGLVSNDVFWIWSDVRHQLWLATLGGGLSRLEKGSLESGTLKFTTFSREDGLSSDVIFTIVDDERGHLWLSSENGISSFDPANETFKNYSRYDGISQPGFSEGAMSRSAEGRISFGAINGLYAFNPSAVNPTGQKVEVVLTGFRLFGKKILPSDGTVLARSISETSYLQLKHNQNVIGLSWAAMDFVLQDKVQYWCRLEGYDEGWRNMGSLNHVEYTRVPPGKYTFQVRVGNPELAQPGMERRLFIEILPPAYQTWWAYLLYFIVALLLLELTRRTVATILRLQNKVVLEKELADVKLNFFTNVSHELRTPLTLILGPAKELLESEKLTDKGLTYARLIEENGMRLLRQVNQLLDFRKVQKGKMSVELICVNLVPLVRTVCRNFEDLAVRKQILFQFGDSVSIINAWVDVLKFESVLYNLLSNAFKFTPSGGKVELFMHITDGGNEVNIEVRDNGRGISKAREKYLFKAFESHYNQVPSIQTGTGIGLALSRELMLLQGGTLTYRVTSGGGATFCVCLKGAAITNETETIQKPLALGVFPAKSSDVATNANEGAANLPLLLIVEDNDDLRSFLRLQLQDHYRIEEAENGRLGWEMVQNLMPDMILSDLMMPEMSGIELLDRVKNHFDTSHIPVVLLTARSSVESQIEGLTYGADAYVTKPFNNEQLKIQLANLLQQRQRLREKFAGPKGRQKEEEMDLFTPKDVQFLDQIRDLIESHLTHPDFKIELLYSAMGMGRSKFFAKLKGLTGLSPIDYVKSYRLSKARTLLESGEYNVSETAFLSGFSDSGYFSKCFKEKYGINPSELSRC
jgi:signal transduction histidine kinase/ligand-binding sensor domain-containing protein/DNA-binding response OmpR family regulator